MFGMFFCFCYVIWTAILVVVRPALLKGGGLKESYGELSFIFDFIFSLRWSVCPLFLQERITGLHFFFLLLFLDSDKSLVRGVLCLQRMLSGVSVHQSSQLFI